MRVYKPIIVVAAVLLLCSCIGEDYDDCISLEEISIPVNIDWSQSNIPVSEDDPTGGSLVHRVSLRFFPTDGSAPMEFYMEGNIFRDTILVPQGRYDVIVMNESVTDVRYWEDIITFSDADDFSLFAANINPMTDARRTARFPYYTPAEGENIIVNPLYLASWSVEDLVVSAESVKTAEPASRASTQALSEIVMRRLIYNVRIDATFTNLSSSVVIQGGVRGFAQKVFMASAKPTQSPATQLYALGNFKFEANELDGTASVSFRSFGRVPEEGDGSYTTSLHALLTNGSLYDAIHYDVTDQVTASGSDGNISISLPGVGGERVELPEVEGGIAVLPWEDEEEIDLN